MKLKWFNNIVLMSFYLGRIEVRLELDRKVTYVGAWWDTKRRKLHVYVTAVPQLQLHLVFPARPLAQASGAQAAQIEREGGASPQDVTGPPEQPADGAQALPAGLPAGEGGEAGAQTASSA